MKSKIFTMYVMMLVIWCGTSFATGGQLSKVPEHADESQKMQPDQVALSAYEVALDQVQEANRALHIQNKSLLSEKNGTKSENLRGKDSNLNEIKQGRSYGKQFMWIARSERTAPGIWGYDLHRQYNYATSEANVATGKGTSIAVVTFQDRSPDVWSNILEIHYANDWSSARYWDASGSFYGQYPVFILYDNQVKGSIGQFKVVLNRTLTNQCYITIYAGKKIGVILGENEQYQKVGDKSFLVYDVSSDIDSFTDDVLRKVYVDEQGLYIVEASSNNRSGGNTVDEVIERIRKTGMLTFSGSVLKVSADGDITIDGKALTEDHFFDNWIQEEHETERLIPWRHGKIIERERESKTVLSAKQPGSNEILKNFADPRSAPNNVKLVGRISSLPDFIAKRKAEIKRKS